MLVQIEEPSVSRRDDSVTLSNNSASAQRYVKNERPNGVGVTDEDEATKKTEKKKKKKKKKDKKGKKKSERRTDPDPVEGPWRFEEHIHHIRMHAPESNAFTKVAVMSLSASWRAKCEKNTAKFHSSCSSVCRRDSPRSLKESGSF